MLKIKDNVDLRKMADDYNLIYCDDFSIPVQDDWYGNIIDCYSANTIINWSSRDIEKIDKDLLYDLIKADLVEKVNE